MLIYILTPLVFVGVLGAALSSSDPLTLYTDFSTALFGHGSWIKWFIGLPLILALLLSVLNAIMGTGRSLYQASEDGALPRWFGKVNVHGVPARAMAFNVAASMLVVLFGSPVRIYIFSNAGYLFACGMSLAGYFVYRQMRPAAERPFRLPGWVRYVALADLPVLGGGLLLRRLERTQHRRRPELRPGPVHPGPGGHVALLPALLLAQALRRPPRASRPCPHRRRCRRCRCRSGPGRGRSVAVMVKAPWRPAPPRAALPAAGVLLASTGQPFTDAAIAEAARLAGAGPAAASG